MTALDLLAECVGPAELHRLREVRPLLAVGQWLEELWAVDQRIAELTAAQPARNVYRLPARTG